MGKNNRARRAAKAKARSNHRSTERPREVPGRYQSGSHGAGSSRQAGHDPIHVWDLVLGLAKRSAESGQRPLPRQLAGLLTGDQRHVAEIGEQLLARALANAWCHGWQPAELVRHTRRLRKADTALLVTMAISADRTAQSDQHIDPRWETQLEQIGAARPSCALQQGAVMAYREIASIEETTAVLVDALAVLLYLPPMDVLIPPPGSTEATVVSQHTSLDDATQVVLERVRNLLAKAESTEFDAEAEAFMAKAHEMMAKHAIDSALLAPQASLDETPMAIRVPIDDPYADAKSLLLQIIAAANRCRSVYHASVAASTVVGFNADLAAVELLHASLLVQAQSALAGAARHAPPGSRERTASYRSAFLVAYANRIGQRLDEINEHVASSLDDDAGAALPVLRARVDHVNDDFERRYPDIRSSSVRSGFDSAGWSSGRHAADLARLNLGDLDTGASGHRTRPEPIAGLPVGAG